MLMSRTIDANDGNAVGPPHTLLVGKHLLKAVEGLVDLLRAQNCISPRVNPPPNRQSQLPSFLIPPQKSEARVRRRERERGARTHLALVLQEDPRDEFLGKEVRERERVSEPEASKAREKR